MNCSSLFLTLALVGAQPDVESLRRLEYVATVETNEVEAPSRTLIHILDWHLLEQSHFDDRSKFEQHLAEVETVQQQQVKLLKELAVDVVYLEGVTPRLAGTYQAQLKVIRKNEALLAEVADLAEVDAQLGAAVAKAKRLQRIIVARAGSAGRLAALDELKPLPAESHAEYEAARPRIEEGRVIKNRLANEKREAAIVTNVLKGDSDLAAVVLGGDHDLSDNLPDGCRYIRIQVKAYPK